MTQFATFAVQDLTTKGTFTQKSLSDLVWSLRYQLLYQYNYSPWVQRGYALAGEDVVLVAPAGEPYIKVVPTLPANAWLIELLDTSDQPGALGYHEDHAFSKDSPTGPKKGSGRSSRGIAIHPATGEEIPLAKVFVKTSLEDGVAPSEVVSHEALETIVDPQVVQEALIRKYLNKEKKLWYIGEVGDPVQSRGYDVGAPEGRPTGSPTAVMADFAYPLWWGQPQRRVATSFAADVELWKKAAQPNLKPFELAPGGYMSVAPEAEPSNWTQIFGSAHASGI